MLFLISLMPYFFRIRSCLALTLFLGLVNANHFWKIKKNVFGESITLVKMSLFLETKPSRVHDFQGIGLGQF